MATAVVVVCTAVFVAIGGSVGLMVMATAFTLLRDVAKLCFTIALVAGAVYASSSYVLPGLATAVGTSISTNPPGIFSATGSDIDKT